MDTSDSEYFESADEEFGEEPPPKLKSTNSDINKNAVNVSEICSIPTHCDISNKTNRNVEVKDSCKTLSTETSVVSSNEEKEVGLKNSSKILNTETSAMKVLLNEENKEVDVKHSTKNLNMEASVTKLATKKENEEVDVKESSKHLNREAPVTELSPIVSCETSVNNTIAETISKSEIHEVKRTEEKCSEDHQHSDNENMWKDDWNDEDWDTIDKGHAESKLVDSVLPGLSNLKTTEVAAKQEESILKRDPNEEEENMWDDDWDQWEESSADPQSKLNNQNNSVQSNTAKTITENSDNENNSGWQSWGSWGVTSLLSTATSSVSTIRNQVTQGITTVLENSMGIPNPEELAKIHEEQRKIKKVAEESHESIPSDESENNLVLSKGFKNLLTGVTQITKLVETTGNKVISGGLGTLETIGKKTMEVLQEGDPGLKKKRAFLKFDQDKPNLSQILREAKEQSEETNKEKKQPSKKVNYETLFDDHQGLVHLEALEMLSKQCNIKLDTLFESASGDTLIEMQETVDQVNELCELPEDENEENFSFDEVKEKLGEYISEVNIPISFEKFTSVWPNVEPWIENMNEGGDNNCRILHEKAIDTLAELTALAVEQFHKTAELLLIKEHRSTADEADSLVQITITVVNFIGFVASKFCKRISEFNTGADGEEINSLITNIYFEAANSSSYIKDAFKLLIPIIQVGAM